MKDLIKLWPGVSAGASTRQLKLGHRIACPVGKELLRPQQLAEELW